MQRRTFLKISTAAAGLSLAGMGINAWLSRKSTGRDKTLVFVLLNGGMDGLSVIYPEDEKRLEGKRKTILLRKERALDWNGYVVHPLLEAWRPLWGQKKLAFIPQFGSPSTRSHSEGINFAQTFNRTSSMNDANLLKIFHDHKICELQDYTSAVYFTSMKPKIFSGPIRPLRVSNQFLGPLMGPQGAVRANDPIFESYKHGELPAGNAEMQALIKKRVELDNLLASVEEKSRSTSYLGEQFDTLADLMTVGHPVKIAFIESLRWDTHARQGVYGGSFHNNLSDLVESVISFIQRIGNRIDDTLIVIQSEFGRTVAENGSEATDHGTGGLCMLLGGGVKGGRVYGGWTDLKSENLVDGRDVPIRTEQRDFWAHILQNYFNGDIPNNIFPEYQFKKLGFELF